MVHEVGKYRLTKGPYKAYLFSIPFNCHLLAALLRCSQLPKHVVTISAKCAIWNGTRVKVIHRVLTSSGKDLLPTYFNVS